MSQLPNNLQKKLAKRIENNALRTLKAPSDLIDFSSNDYLGLTKSTVIFDKATDLLNRYHLRKNGATGSRLLTGNHALYETTESLVANFHNAEAALLFNSGYDANLGFFGSVPQRGDVILYDELCHASIRDGIQLSAAKAYKFGHDDLNNFIEIADRVTNKTAEVYVVTESVFSMDGDRSNLKGLSQLCKTHGFHLIVDEAHAVGVFGPKGAGLVPELGLEEAIFARIVTFGKAMGCHGAAVLGTESLKQYLINFARSFIYTTGLPPHSLATILAAYETTSEVKKNREALLKNIELFNNKVKAYALESFFIASASAIHCCVLPGNDKVKSIATSLSQKGYQVLPILSPTVPMGKERLRVCLHSFNTEEEIETLLQLMATFVK